MANELQTNTTTNMQVYAIIRNSSANVYDVSTNTFGSYLASSVPSYAVPLTESGTGSGYYVGDFPTAITTPDVYSIEFFQTTVGYTDSSNDLYIAGGTMAWSGSAAVSSFTPNLVSLAFLQTAMSSTANSALQLQVIPVATQAIQRYCNRIFSVQNYSEYYDGCGDRSLLLNQRPIVSLTSVIFQPYGTDPQTIPGSNFIVSVNTGMISWMPSSTYGSFFYQGYTGQSLYQVNYSAGYSSIPADLQQACADICRNLILWSNVDVSAKVERIGGTSGYQFGAGPDTGKIITDVLKPILQKYKSYIV